MYNYLEEGVAGRKKKKKAKSSLEKCQRTEFLNISSTAEVLCPFPSEKKKKKGLIITTVNIHAARLILFPRTEAKLFVPTVRMGEMESLSGCVICLSY